MQNEIKQKIDQKDYKGLMELMTTPEALSLSYDEKNKHFVTSHKLQDFGKCPYGDYLRWVAGVEKRVPDDSEALLIGSAFDDLAATAPSPVSQSPTSIQCSIFTVSPAFTVIAIIP